MGTYTYFCGFSWNILKKEILLSVLKISPNVSCTFWQQHEFSFILFQREEMAQAELFVSKTLLIASLFVPWVCFLLLSFPPATCCNGLKGKWISICAHDGGLKHQTYQIMLTITKCPKSEWCVDFQFTFKMVQQVLLMATEMWRNALAVFPNIVSVNA